METVSDRDPVIQYVTFLIGKDTYGIDVSCVQEITGLRGITRVPDSKRFMKGVLDLRGVVVPLVDMRLRFGLEEKEYDAMNAVIIASMQGRRIGMIVDAVSDVLGIPLSGIQNTLHYPVNIDTDCVSGVYSGSKGITVLLDAGKVLDPEREDV